jgi:hypothetical protein
MTGRMHIADAQGDTVRTWDTLDPATVREVEEVFRQAQAAGRLSTTTPGPAPASRSP